MNKDIEYKPLTREELTVYRLERMREEKIVQLVNQDVYIDTLNNNQKRKGNSSQLRTKLTISIRSLEAELLVLEEDLTLIEAKLKVAKKLLK